jgi:hypothetical protein
MKNKTAPAQIYRLCLLVLLILLSFGVSAQTGQTIELAKTNSPIDKTAALTDFKYVTGEGEDFFERLNGAGKLGYKLENITLLPANFNKIGDPAQLAALLRLKKGNVYEYSWLEPEAVSTFSAESTVGFDVFENIPVSLDSGYSPTSRSEKTGTEQVLDNLMSALSATYGSYFILERANAGKNQKDYELLTSKFGWGKSPKKTLQSGIEKISGEGFRPTFMFPAKLGIASDISVLAVKETNDIKSVGAKPEYKLLRTEYSFEKKVNRLAQQGFRLIYITVNIAQKFALMSKNSESAATFSYKWIDTFQNPDLSEIAKLAEQGFAYHSVMWENELEKKLIFEKKTGADEKYDYKTVKLTTWERQSGKTESPLPPTSEEIKAEFERLLKEGYVVRDLFYAGGINVLFEHKK